MVSGFSGCREVKKAREVRAEGTAQASAVHDNGQAAA